MQIFLEDITALRKELDFETAIISSVLDGNYHVEICQSDLLAIHDGDNYNLADTYCYKVISTNQIVTYNNVSKLKQLTLHPAYTLMQLLSYIGCPIYKNGVIWGTLNFSSTDHRHKLFDEAEIASVTNLAKKISLYLDT